MKRRPKNPRFRPASRRILGSPIFCIQQIPWMPGLLTWFTYKKWVNSPGLLKFCYTTIGRFWVSRQPECIDTENIRKLILSTSLLRCVTGFARTLVVLCEFWDSLIYGTRYFFRVRQLWLRQNRFPIGWWPWVSIICSCESCIFLQMMGIWMHLVSRSLGWTPLVSLVLK